MTEWEGGLVPEARSYLQTMLPHQCGDRDALFPRAEAAAEPGDRDLVAPEHHWWPEGEEEQESEEEMECTAAMVACLGTTMIGSNYEEPNAKPAVQHRDGG